MYDGFDGVENDNSILHVCKDMINDLEFVILMLTGKVVFNKIS